MHLFPLRKQLISLTPPLLRVWQLLHNSLGHRNRHLNERTEEDLCAKRLIVHPDYNKIPIASDIALTQLSKPATFNARVKTICLSSQNEVVLYHGFVQLRKLVDTIQTDRMNFGKFRG